MTKYLVKDGFLLLCSLYKEPVWRQLKKEKTMGDNEIVLYPLLKAETL
jgi:hypothetical protein